MDILNLQTSSFVERVASAVKASSPPPIVAPPPVADAGLMGTVARVNKYTVNVSASLSAAVSVDIYVSYVVTRRYSGGAIIDTFSGGLTIKSGSQVGSYQINNYFAGIIGGERFSVELTSVAPNPAGNTNISIGGIA